MKCQFCKAIFADKDEVQLHQVSSCPAIEEEDFTGINHPCANVIFQWKNDGKASSKVHVLLSDREEQIELTSVNGCYLSHEISIQVGKYDGQIIADDDMFPIEEVEVDLKSNLIDLKIERRLVISRNQINCTELSSERCESLSSLNNDESSIRRTQTVPYKMNEKAALAKKMIACNKECYKIEMKSGCCRIDFSTASFEYFKNDVNTYIRNSEVYKVVEDKLFVDMDGKEPQDTLKVWSKRNTKEFLFTINLYRTKSNAMINGAKYRLFVDQDLPVLLRMLEEREEVISEANNQFKRSIPDRMYALNRGNEAIDIDETQKSESCEAIMTRRTRKKKIYEDYDLGSTSRRTRNSTQETKSDNGESEKYEGPADNEDDWESKPKFWDKYGENEWTITIAKSRNGPKSCVENCNKNNSSNMVRCDGCGSWCHYKCIPADIIWNKEQDFLCSTCNSKENAMLPPSNLKEEGELPDCGPTKSLQDKIIAKNLSAICLDGADTAPITDTQLTVINEEVGDKLNGEGETSNSVIVYGCEPIPIDNGNGEKYEVSVLNEYIKEISSWYKQVNNSVTEMVKGKVVSSPDFQLDGCSIYYYDPPVNKPKEMQLVINRKGQCGVDIIHIDKDETHNSMDFIKDLLGSMKGDQYKDLYTIILKQKEKLDEMKNIHNMMMLPEAIMSHINFLSQKLVAKERKIKELDEINKKGKVEMVELKRLKKDSDSKAENSAKENVKLSREIMDLKKSNAELIKENKRLKDNESVLESKVNLLTKVSSDLNENQNHTIIIDTDNSRPQSCEECPKLKRKLDTAMKEKSSLNDKLTEATAKLDKVDTFYQDLITQKDKTILCFTEISDTFDDVETKFKRLLSYHKAIGEIKHMQSIKDYLLNDGKPQLVDSATNTDDMEMVDVSTNTDQGLEMVSEANKSGTKKKYEPSIHSTDPKLLDYVRSGNQENIQNLRSRNDDGDDSSRIKRLCWFGSRCFRQNCKFSHEGSSVPPKCRFGLRCRRGNCLFRHMDDCEDREGCNDINKCQKRHIVHEATKSNATLGQQQVLSSNSGNTNALSTNSSVNSSVNQPTPPAASYQNGSSHSRDINTVSTNCSVDGSYKNQSIPLATSNQYGSGRVEPSRYTQLVTQHQPTYSYVTAPSMTAPVTPVSSMASQYFCDRSVEENHQRYAFSYPVGVSEQYYPNYYPVKRLSKNTMCR